MILDWLFQSIGTKILKKILPIVKKINDLEESCSNLTQEEMLKKFENWKQEFQKGNLNLDDILVEVFAIVREVSKRTVKKRQFDVQIIGGYVIHKGMIAEMKTGEGKTLATAMPAILNAISGKTVFVVTVNDYLVKRDTELLRPIYEYLGFSINAVLSTCNQNEKIEQYNSDIVYITNNEICFDYLRDNMVKSLGQKLQKTHYFAIVDEIDNIFIDESRTPLIISGPENSKSDLYNTLNPFFSLLEEGDYKIEAKSKNVTFEPTGFDKLEKFLTIKGLINNDLFSENIFIYHIASNLLKAHKGMFKDKDYVTTNDEVVIIDEFTGRLAFGRKFSNGLHQALEAKENVKVNQESKTQAFISYTNFFRLFEKIGGMTGTAQSEADEFETIYGLKIVQIPTNRPIIRKDDTKIRLYHKKLEMYQDAIEIIAEKHQRGQPILLCTPSVFDSEILSEVLNNNNLPHYVLNAKNHEKEASIVAQAGQSYSITIATSMAGRGTDIMLGGCIEYAIKDMYQNNPDIDIAKFESEMLEKFSKDRLKVLKTGGLFVMLLGALDSEKSQAQFIGRAGRQGDPGESMYFVSLEDDLLQPLFQDALNRIFISFFFPNRCNTNNKAQSLIKDIQSMYQSHYFEIRKNMLKFDDVINNQRKAVYCFRDYLMACSNPKGFIEKIAKILIDSSFNKNIAIDKKSIEDKFGIIEFTSKEDLENQVITKIQNNLTDVEIQDLNSFILNEFDEHWINLINELENLKRTIYLVSYEQKDPVFEFRKAAYNIFVEIIKEFQVSLIDNVLNQRNLESGSDDYSNLFSGMGGNECFCGSKKMFNECCGKQIFENFNLNQLQNTFDNLMKNLEDQDSEENSKDNSEDNFQNKN